MSAYRPATPSCPHEDQIGKLDSRLDDINQKLAVLNERLPKQLPIRLDRLEQSEKSRSFWTRTAVGASLAAAATTAWNLITTGKAHP